MAALEVARPTETAVLVTSGGLGSALMPVLMLVLGRLGRQKTQLLDLALGSVWVQLRLDLELVAEPGPEGLVLRESAHRRESASRPNSLAGEP